MGSVGTSVRDDYYDKRTWGTYHAPNANTANIQYSTRDKTASTEFGELNPGDDLELVGFKGHIYFLSASGTQTLNITFEEGEDPEPAALDVRVEVEKVSA